MKKTIKGYVIGFLTAAILLNIVTYAASGMTLYNVIMQGVTIVVDGQKLNPTDVNGNRVEPMIYNGTTYLPVRAVANAMGKAVYWDGPSFTVYLGEMNGRLEYPTDEMSIDDSIGDGWYKVNSSGKLKDNLGNIYSRAVYPSYYGDNNPYEKICNMKYSNFKGTIYVMNGTSTDRTTQIVMKADGKTIYTSPEIDKTTAPIHFDVNITGCYDLQIFSTTASDWLAIGDAGFYQ